MRSNWMDSGETGPQLFRISLDHFRTPDDHENPCKSLIRNRDRSRDLEYNSGIPSTRKSELPPTVRGYSTYEVVSAYQKAIRRSQVDDAIYWGSDLVNSGYANWAWKRLRLIVSEDIGPAAPGLPADVYALEQNARQPDGKLDKDSKMFFVHATILAARAPKSRIVDWALFSVASSDYDADRPIPDEALDQHTRRGKQMGRGPEHFADEGARLIQPDGLAPEELIELELLNLEDRYRQQQALETDR